MINKLNGHIKYDGDVAVYDIDLNIVKNFPIKVAIKSLELLQKNIKNGDTYFKFSENVQSFINENKTIYNNLVKNECVDFYNFSNIYFKHMSGPLYQYADPVFSYVNRIYELETYFENSQIKDLANIPQILWKIKKDSENFNLHVKNIDELTNKFGKDVMLYSLVLFKDHLNYEHQIINKNTDKPFNISGELFSQLFNSKTNTHDILESFHGKDYFLTSFFNEQIKQTSSPEEILKFVLINKNIKNLVDSDNISNDNNHTNVTRSKLKIK
jgi:hypothetical protein